MRYGRKGRRTQGAPMPTARMLEIAPPIRPVVKKKKKKVKPSD